HIPLFYQQSGAFAPGYLNYRALKKRVYIYFFEKKLMQKAACLLALNEAEVSSYKSLGLKTPSSIVTNGVNIPVIKKSLPAEYNVIGCPAILPDDFVILFLARLHTIKGPDFLLDVFIKLSQKYPKARLIIAGPDQHNLTQILINRITEVGIGSRVLIPGMISGDKKQQLIVRADLFCAPSSAEGFSISVLEAMSNRTPVMITPECNFPAVEENSAGWIIEKNMEKWAEKISWLIENPAELLARGERAYELVKNSYTWEKVVDKLEAVYLEGIKKQLSDREK
ncbi:MAG: glycosyltransferase, partial [Chloroflexota bacterium]